MSTTCPSCHHVRPADTRAPHWQCPKCGVAYAQAAEAVEAARRPRTARPASDQARPDADIAWGKWFAMLAIAAVAWYGVRHATWEAGTDAASVVSEQEIGDLAAGVKAEEVVIYTTSWCGYCAQAKRWMKQNGFAFTECDVEADARCAREFAATGSRGVPVLRVRGEWLDGFNSDEFVAALQQ